MLFFGSFVPFDDCVCSCSASLCLFTMGDQLDEPIASSGSPPFSVFNCFFHIIHGKYNMMMMMMMMGSKAHW